MGSVLSRKTSLIRQKYVILDCHNNVLGCKDDLSDALVKAHDLANSYGKTMYIYNRINDEMIGSAYPK